MELHASQARYCSAWELKNAGGTLYFSAYDDDHGSELWKSDGTESGTTLVRDIYPGTSEYYGSSYPNSSYPMYKEELNGMLYFVAYDEEHGRELWRSDGTESGTVLVMDTLPGPDSGLAFVVPRERWWNVVLCRG